MALDSMSWIDFSSHRGTYRSPLRGSIGFYDADVRCSDLSKRRHFLIYKNKEITCIAKIDDLMEIRVPIFKIFQPLIKLLIKHFFFLIR